MKVGDLVKRKLPTNSKFTFTDVGLGLVIEEEIDPREGIATFLVVWGDDDYGTYWTYARNVEVVSERT